MKRLECGNAENILRTLEERSIHCVVTSPPYWGLRDYGIKGQLGLEPRASQYISRLVDIFALVKTALVDDGVVFVNLGDTYAGYKDGKFPPQSFSNGEQRCMQMSNAPHRSRGNLKLDGFKHKDMIGIPWRFAIAMQGSGWYLRQDIIWAKSSYTPEKVRDRFVRSHEYIFLFSKQPRYFFNGDAVRVPSHTGTKLRPSVWTIPANKSTSKGHFSTFPVGLVEPCILAGCPEKGTVLDPFNGTGTVGLAALSHGRSYIGIELHPDFYEVTKKRLAQYS